MNIAEKYQESQRLEKEYKEDLFNLLSDYFVFQKIEYKPWFDGVDLNIEMPFEDFKKISNETLLKIFNLLNHEAAVDSVKFIDNTKKKLKGYHLDYPQYETINENIISETQKFVTLSPIKNQVLYWREDFTLKIIGEQQ